MTSEELLKRARQALAEGAYRTAQALFAQVIAQNPRSADAYYGLALASGKLGDYQTAAEHFRACAELDPRRAAAHINQGVAYVLLGKPDDAIAALRLGLQLAPNSAYAYYNLGVAYRAKGILDLAAEAFREAVRKDPQLVQSYLNLGNVLFDLARYREAATWYEEGLKVAPEHEPLKQGLQAVQKVKALQTQTQQASADRPEPATGAPPKPTAPEPVTPFSSVVERAERLSETLELAQHQERLVEDMLHLIEKVVRPAVGALSHSLVHSSAGGAELELRVREYREAMAQIERAARQLADGVQRLSHLGKRFALAADR